MAANASLFTGELPEAPRLDLSAVQKSALALLCLLGGAAPLLGRAIPGRSAEVGYGLAVAAVLLATTLLARRSVALSALWQLPFACFVLAIVQVLNNAVPPVVLTRVLHEHTVSGNPLASTVNGTLVIQLLETLLAIVPIVVLIRLAGLDLNSIYGRAGRLGASVFASIGFVAIYILIGLSPMHRMIPIHGTMSFSHYLSLTPALLILVFSNGFQEEFLFRGLFLPRYTPVFGAWSANILQALVFAFAHAGVTYTPSALVFIVAVVFPAGLFLGWLMRHSQGVIAPAILHAGVDIPIYLAFLTFVL